MPVALELSKEIRYIEIYLLFRPIGRLYRKDIIGLAILVCQRLALRLATRIVLPYPLIFRIDTRPFMFFLDDDGIFVGRAVLGTIGGGLSSARCRGSSG